jgi:hypothetical protein
MKGNFKIDYDKVFHSYTKHRAATYNNTMAYDNKIFTFKERVNGFNKIVKGLEIRPLSKKALEPVEILVKEDNKKKVYIDQSQSDHEPVDSQEEEEDLKKELKKTNSEPNLDTNHEEKESKNLLNTGKNCLVIGGSVDISDALVKRGWNDLKDADPKVFSYNLLNTIKIADIPFDDIPDNIIVNHFRRGGEITRKVGLLKSLRNLYYMNVCPDDFFPRAYDLGEKQDVEDFIEDFKTSKAIALLRNCKELNGMNVNKDEITTSLNIVKRKLNLLIGATNLDNKFEKIKQRTFNKTYTKNENFEIEKISDKEWEIISNENMDIYREQIEKIKNQGLLSKENTTVIQTPLTRANNKSSKNPKIKSNKSNLDKKVSKKNYIQNEEDKKLEEEIKKDFENQEKVRKSEKEKLDKIIQEREEERIKKEQELELKKKLEEEKKNNKNTKPLTKEEKEQKWKEETFLNNTTNNTRPPRLPQTDNVTELLPEISEILEKLWKYLPQYELSGTRNIWIVKPSGLSRGRGVNCIDQLNDILSNIRLHNQTVIQKYIENPLIIQGRKFDIRQWVLVTNLNPLTIYLFDTPYVRFGAEDFHIDDFKNIFSHLTGNSIAKHSDKFENSEIEGDMWENEQFREFLKKKYGRDCWPEVQEKIKKIAIYALMSARHRIVNRKNTYEVFGFDIMVDELLNVYLIEINLSPDWTYSTKITEKLVKIASEDMMKIAVDLPEENLKPPEERKTIDTGRFKLIYNSSKFPNFEKNYVNKEYC